ncbi:hypothetical protein [Streptomyces sp. NPDC002088]|uniref:hypothetical protein n=1 Tax=Streptomyces sp. NPDC002088 TaxID=3154665 RepID=UPI003316545E
MSTAIALGIVVLYTAALLYAAWSAISLRSQLDRTKDELLGERLRRRRTEKQALALVEKVTPLIEQTDWITGRWNGQYNTLVRMEMERNFAVVEARRAMWDIPLVADHIKNTYGAQK